MIDTLAALYDLQHEHRDLLTYTSPKTGDPVSLSFLMGDTVEQVSAAAAPECTGDRHGRADEPPEPSRSALRYPPHALLRELPRQRLVPHAYPGRSAGRSLSKGPAEQADPRVALHLVRETDRGIIVNGARMRSSMEAALLECRTHR
jgi:4-hydroxyphenylacetate 3-monooxygenase